jgi:hypothetical protein
MVYRLYQQIGFQNLPLPILPNIIQHNQHQIPIIYLLKHFKMQLRPLVVPRQQTMTINVSVDKTTTKIKKCEM